MCSGALRYFLPPWSLFLLSCARAPSSGIFWNRKGRIHLGQNFRDIRREFFRDFFLSFTKKLSYRLSPIQMFYFNASEDYQTCMLLINFNLYFIFLLLIDYFLKWQNIGNHIIIRMTNRFIESCSSNHSCGEILFIWWLKILLFIALLTKVSLPV